MIVTLIINGVEYQCKPKGVIIKTKEQVVNISKDIIDFEQEMTLHELEKYIKPFYKRMMSSRYLTITDVSLMLEVSKQIAKTILIIADRNSLTYQGNNCVYRVTVDMQKQITDLMNERNKS